MGIFLSVIGMYTCGYYPIVLLRNSNNHAKASLFYIDINNYPIILMPVVCIGWVKAKEVATGNVPGLCMHFWMCRKPECFKLLDCECFQLWEYVFFQNETRNPIHNIRFVSDNPLSHPFSLLLFYFLPLPFPPLHHSLSLSFSPIPVFSCFSPSLIQNSAISLGTRKLKCRFLNTRQPCFWPLPTYK